MLPVGPEFHKPKSIIAAKNLLYAALFIGCLAVIARDFILGITNNGGILGIALTILGFVVIIFLIKTMDLCKKWARTVLLVLYCIMIFTIALHPNLITGILEGVLLTIQILLQIVAFIFLFSKESNIWFNKQHQ
jgi:hypothetical protein